MTRRGCFLLLALGIFSACSAGTESAPSPSPATRASRTPGSAPQTIVAQRQDGDVVLLDSASGGTIKTLAKREDALEARDFETSPDGRTLYFSRNVGEHCSEVVRLDISSGESARWSMGSSPTVSPDSRFIAWLQSEVCGIQESILHVYSFNTGGTRTWVGNFESVGTLAGALWATDSRHLYVQDCGVDTCWLSKMDTSAPAGKFRLEFIWPEAELDEAGADGAGSASITTRGTHLVSSLGYGSTDGSERYPLIEFDPATGRIIAELFESPQIFGYFDFDDSGRHMLYTETETGDLFRRDGERVTLIARHITRAVWVGD